jgi:hypothetical protein
VQRDDVFEHVGRDPRARPQRRQAERRVRRIPLGPFERDLQRRAAAGRVRPQQLVDRHPEGRRDRLQQRQLRLAPAVLDHRQRRGRAADGLGELGER